MKRKVHWRLVHTGHGDDIPACRPGTRVTEGGASPAWTRVTCARCLRLRNRWFPRLTKERAVHKLHRRRGQWWSVALCDAAGKGSQHEFVMVTLAHAWSRVTCKRCLAKRRG